MNLPSIRRQILVACAPAVAYDLFVHDIGTWWPIESFGCYGAGASVSFDGARFIEVGPEGDRALWGTVLDADPPHRVTFSWHPGQDEDSASRVSVSFDPSGEATLLTLEHDGWESFSDPGAARSRYAGGWVSVLQPFTDHRSLDAAGSPEGEQWFILEHTASAGRAVFAEPGFRRHLDFLHSLARRGVLVAAGPLPDSPGSGATIVRTPDLAAAQQVIAAAQDEDEAVTSGLLDVRARPWRVMLSA